MIVAPARYIFAQYSPMEMMPHPKATIRIRSFSQTEWVTILTNAYSCDCPEFQAIQRGCEHLRALGIYRLKPFIASSHPTFSQALSAVVKSIRLRRIEDATYWLMYLHTFKEPSQRFRTARRILIASAEDGHSIAVMETVAAKLPKICKSGVQLHELVTEAVRICKVQNWWHPSTGGPDYIYSGMVGQRDLAYFAGQRNSDSMKELIRRGIEERQPTTALAGVMGMGEARVGATKQAELILALAREYGHPLAERLALIHLSSKTALSSDNNFLCQAAWLMAGGQSPVANETHAVDDSEVQQLINQAEGRWRHPEPIPSWCCDGLHSAGNDVRFAGIWHHMNAACNAYEHFKRLDPADVWLPEFQCYDGLRIDYSR